MTKTYSKWTNTSWLTQTRSIMKTPSSIQIMSILTMKRMITIRSSRKWTLHDLTRASQRSASNRPREKWSANRNITLTWILKTQLSATSLLRMSKVDQSPNLEREMALDRSRGMASYQQTDNEVGLEYLKLGLKRLMVWSRYRWSPTTSKEQDTKTQSMIIKWPSKELLRQCWEIRR